MTAATATKITASSTQPLPRALSPRRDPELLDALWAMTHEERVEAMWAGELTLGQLCAWSSRRPDDIPRIGKEFAWIVMRTPEWAEADEQLVENVVQFPVRTERRAAA